MKAKEKSGKAALNSTFKKLRLLHLFPSLRNKQMEKKMETVIDFIFSGSKNTADGDCSHEIKTFAPWKKSYDEPRQHIQKSETSLC